MRLSDVLSEPPDLNFKKVDDFLKGKNLVKGKPKKIKSEDIGAVNLNFFCTKCKRNCFFYSKEDLLSIVIEEQKVSIDCVLSCFICKKTSVTTWFIIASENKMSAQDPNVRILKRTFKLPEGVTLLEDQFEGHSDLLQKARHAHNEGLGLGAAIYLRHILEQIVYKVAKEANISTVSAKGNRLSFKDLWEKVDKAEHIVPAEFSKDGYQLFAKLSEIIHGKVEEQEALTKYQPLRRLVVAIIENVRNRPEILAAWTKLR